MRCAVLTIDKELPMSIPATIPFNSSPPAPRPWTPDSRDRLIFQWVKFDGHKQSWVADQLGIHQTTVSRIVDRYERWIARGGPSQQGSPSHDERVRVQRWLAYERNEWILASALRIAGEMERAIDTSKSTTTRPISNPSAESEVRTEHKVIDRSGIAARFLRLAYRINMDQLKLVEQDPLPALEPFSIEEAGDQDLAEAPDAECHGPPIRADRVSEACPAVAPSDLPFEPAETHEPTAPPQERPAASMRDDAAVTSVELSPNTSPTHKTHNPPHSKSIVTANRRTTSAKSNVPRKPSASACLVASSSPEVTAPLTPPGTAAGTPSMEASLS